MNQVLFEKILRECYHRRPFIPFVVELVSGERIRVDEPTFAFAGPAAGYLNPALELEEFACDQVKDIRLAEQEMPS